MPKIQQHFRAGKMNKDLDERLVAKGEYRDALNVQVSSSEGSDVGAIQNILGNSAHIKNTFNKDTGASTNYNAESGSLDVFGIPNTCKTIGSIKYDKTECIYYFVTSDTLDAVIEYNQSTDVVSPILVDKNNILNFSKDKLITGINIIEGLLFFTDDNSEPKGIDIKRFREASIASTSGFSNHTEVYGRDFIEHDITVIKKSPNTAPLITKSDSAREGVGTGISPLTTSKKFTRDIANTNPVEYESIPSGESVTLSWSGTPNYQIGDILVLKNEYSAGNNDLEIFEVTVQITASASQFSSVTAEILSNPDNMPNEVLVWEVLLQEDEAMFEYKFPRFAYRWKYNDGQYSSFSPFTQAVFLPNKFKYLSADGYNLGMTNNLRKLKIHGLETPPSDVKEIEILYKESNSNLVYSVDEVPLNNQELEIESELIHKVIESNQILRPWDNVPLKAKAQEAIGNRLVYANYLQNFNVTDTLQTNFFVSGTNNANPQTPEESIKSIRNYQLGVVWRDTYGRETPVFTSKESTLTLGGIDASKINKLKAAVSSDAPPWATHYKYFIKETANEYYNLALDRFYLAEDGNVWLSFPSSERNKVDEETYLYLKKQHDNDNNVKEVPKYKILSISNKAPDFIAEVAKTIANADVNAVATSNPGVDVTTFEFTGPGGTGGDQDTNPSFYTAFKAQNFISIVKGGNATRDYEIKSGGPTGTDNGFRVSITLPMEETFLDSITNADPGSRAFEVLVKEKVIERKPEFEGRFFVKINRDATFKSNIMDAFGSVEVQYGIVSSSDVPVIAPNTGIGTTGGGDSQQALSFKDRKNNPSGCKVPTAQSDKFGLVWAAFSGGSSSPVDVGKTSHPIIDKHLQGPGADIRFYDASGNKSEVYNIKESSVNASRRGYNGVFGTARTTASNARKYAECVMDRNFQSGFTPVGIEIVEELVSSNNEVLSSTNPAVFETEPKEQAELDIYYEASDAFPIAQLATTKTLSWFNCYSFGNGVESDRIRDDFNAVRIGKGVKVSAVLDEPYAEERKGNGFIFSQIFNSTSGVNRLNQFIQALPITKDLNPAYGSIQKLHARDTDLITLCEDKCLKVLANKDALFNADGNSNVTSNKAVLGQTIPYVGEYGISKNPESFASYGFRAFFTDKNRGVVLRLSRNGLDEISKQGMSDYFSDKLALESVVLGSYDDNKDCYNVSFSDETVSYKQGLEGWPTRKSFVPESAVSLNNTYYTFKGSQIWSHDNEVRNNFYGVQYKSSVKLIINDAPSSIKNFKTIAYEGDIGWVSPSVITDQQKGKVPSFKEKEGLYYNFIKGQPSTWNGTSGTLDTKTFPTQGIDVLGSASGDLSPTTFTLTVKENND
jgi:hypothetical protein